MCLQIAFEGAGVVPGQQDLRCACGQDHRAVHLRIERLEVLQLDLCQSRGHCYIDVALNGHTLEERMVVDEWKLHIEEVRLGNDVFDSLQLGHVIACLIGHLQVAVAQWQTARLVACQGPAHTALTPVVGGQRQVPVVKHAVEFLQVIQCGPGRFKHVTPFVAKQVLLEVEVFAGGRHELPHACRFGAGNGFGVEGGLDEGQQSQLGGHVAPLQLFDDMVDVPARTLGHAQHVVRAGGIPLLAVTHQIALQVRHGKTAADTLPDVPGRLQAKAALALELNLGWGVLCGIRAAARGLCRCRCRI